MNRRSFLQMAGAGLAATPLLAATKPRKRVAMLITEVRRHSHGQHFLDRFLEGYGWGGRWHKPEVDLVSIYVDQFPESDLAREREKRLGIKIYPSIAEALTLGGSNLAVDGVIIIAEHGRYKKTEKGQTLYPRYEFFKETVKVFEASGRAVPVFNDKHLSTDWTRCQEMVADSKRLGFPFHAGSSLPVTRRMPELELPHNVPLKASVSICYGGVDSYDFHGLETAQCMSERRKGGESGIRSMQALRGAAVWKRVEEDEETRRLFLAALSRSEHRTAPEDQTFAPPSMELAKMMARDPVGYFYEHVDGFRTAMFMMNGLVRDFTYAGLRDNGKIETCIMYLPMPGDTATTANFFNPLCWHIEQMVLTGREPYPVERTLLTSGMTLFGVESLHRGQVKLETPEMANVKYHAERESKFWRA